MFRYFAKRLLMLIPVLLGVVLIVYTILFFSPGDPARIILGDMAGDKEVEQLTRDMGLDDPYIVQLFRYIRDIVLHGDFGDSYANGKPVAAQIFQRFPTTLKLTLMSIGLASVLGILFGIIAATRQYSVFDSVVTLLSLIGISMPGFWSGLLLIVVFSVNLGMLPASGFYGPEYYILPVLTIGLACTAGIMRTTRSAMLDVIRQDYIRTARAKGQREGAIIFRHALRNALIPVVTLIGMQFGRNLAGTVVVETVFAIPGLGKLLVDSIGKRDRTMICGGTLLLAFSFSLVNLLVDLLYALIDPRITAQYSRKKAKRRAKAKA